MLRKYKVCHGKTSVTLESFDAATVYKQTQTLLGFCRTRSYCYGRKVLIEIRKSACSTVHAECGVPQVVSHYSLFILIIGQRNVYFIGRAGSQFEINLTDTAVFDRQFPGYLLCSGGKSAVFQCFARTQCVYFHCLRTIQCRAAMCWHYGTVW